MNRWTILVLLSSVLVVAGCGGEAESDESTSSSLANSSSGEGKSQTSEVEVSIASWAEVQELIKSQQGKVVVVDLWSSWCVPCIREFPNLVKLQEAFPDQVACISVCLNYDGTKSNPPESHLERVTEFLTKQNARFDNVICSDSDMDLYDAIELSSIPAVYVYDQDGNQVRRFDNEVEDYGDEGFSYPEHIVPLVESLLQE